MKKSLISACLLLALAACQGEEPKSKAPAASPPAPVMAPVTAQATPAKAVVEQVAAELKASATQLADETETVMKDAAMQTMQGEASAPVQVQSAVKQLKPAAVKQEVAAKPVMEVAKVLMPEAVQQTTSSVTAGDVEKGKVLARKCAACHSFESQNKMGPGLAGVVGRQAGSVSGFKYQLTDFIKSGKAWRWDEAHLAAWVCDSKNAVKDFTGDAAAKTKMGAQRICDTSQQADIIAYLKTL